MVESVPNPAVAAWVTAALQGEAGWPPDEAAQAARTACMWHGRPADLIDAATAVAVARSTPLLPGGKAWWDGDGAGLRRQALRLDHWPDEAYDRIGELLAEPAPDVMDQNWTAEMAFHRVPLPPNAEVGTVFVVGDGMGHRWEMAVARRDGRLGAEMIGACGHPLDDLWGRADDAVQRIVSTP